MNKKVIFLIFTIIMIIAVILIIITLNDNKKDSIKQNFLNINQNEEINVNKSITNNMNKTDNITERKDDMKLYIKVNNKILTATLENNPSSIALIGKLEQNDLTIHMEDYANLEKVGSLGFDLPRNDKQITTEPGDIILYQGNSLTIYYEINRWNFTKLGHIDNINQEELKQILGKGNVTVTLSLERN